jgi:aromatic-L-amino-acid/L-tryptophan decarboxylase
MARLELKAPELDAAMDRAFELVREFWRTLPRRGSFHESTGAATERLFTRAWAEEGRGAKVRDDFSVIAAPTNRSARSPSFSPQRCTRM